MSRQLVENTGGGEKEPVQKLAQSIWKLRRDLVGVSLSLKRMGNTFTQLTAVSGKLKRTLLSFDQIQRLQAPSASGSKKLQQWKSPLDSYLESGSSTLIKDFLGKMQDMGEAVGGDLTNAFRLLNGEAVGLDRMSQSLSRLTGSAVDLRGGIAEARGELTWLTDRFFGSLVTADSTNAVQGMGSIRAGVQALAQPLENLKDKWEKTGIASSQAAVATKNAWGAMDIWFQDNVVGGVESGISTMLGGLTGVFNGVLGAVEGAVNAAVKSVNTLKLTIPKWIPLIGGNVLSFSLPTISVPKIPALAQGAVLPANQPFLAVVGDQRHGTNVEAPLTTIEEAVANVMQEQTGAILAGFEASVQVQREILEAVLGIRIGDELIARAAQRYRSHQAVMMGGGV